MDTIRETTSLDRPETAPVAERTRRDDLPRLVRVRAVAPLAPVAGWLTAWGAAAVAAASLRAADVDLGLGLGIAESATAEDRLLPGLWLLIVQAAAFVVGGYVAARMARVRGLAHAALAWAVAMLATGADALVATLRDGPTVLSRLDIPYWAQTGLESGFREVLALGAFAVAALIGILIGGGMGQAANVAARSRAERAISGERIATDEPGDSWRRPGEPMVTRHETGAEPPAPSRAEPEAVRPRPHHIPY